MPAASCIGSGHTAVARLRDLIETSAKIVKTGQVTAAAGDCLLVFPRRKILLCSLRGGGMLVGVRAIAAALAMVSVSLSAVAQVVPPGAQIVPPSDQPGRERERFERPPVPLAQPGGPAISVPGIEAPP